MRLTHPVSLCVISVLEIALISHLWAQDPRHSSGKAINPSPSSVAVAEPAAGHPPGSASLARIPDSYGKIPLSFEVNQGQTDGRVRFVARGGGYSVFLTSSEVLLSLHRIHGAGVKPAGLESPLQRRRDLAAMAKNVDSATVSMRLIGSNPDAKSNGADLLPGKVNYLLGKDPRKWHTDIPTYAKVRLSQVYPGVDLVYYGNQEGQLEHDFVVAPKADPNQIEFDMRDQDRAPALTGGELRLATKAGEVKLRAPLAYQVIDGQRKQVSVAYEDAGSGHIRFRLGSYDTAQPLVIDPVLAYSAVFGGNNPNLVNDIYVFGMGIDSQRNAYVAGLVNSSTGFPLVDPYQSTPGSGYVSKLNAAGTALLYSTYLGGSTVNIDSLAVDAEGRAYVGGISMGGDIPIVNASQPKFGGAQDGFITVLNPAGDAVEWSTYVGGAGYDQVNALAVDASGNLYATGITTGSFPASHNFFPTGCSATALNDGGAGDINCTWVAKYSQAGALQYSTFYGPGVSQGIDVDTEGSAYLTGNFLYPSASWVLPTTAGAFSSKCNAIEDGLQYQCAFVAKLSPAGNSLLYSTTLGANGAYATSIKADRYGDAYVGGFAGAGFPTWSSAFQRTCRGDENAIIVKLNASGTNLIWSTYLGGSGDDQIWNLALDQYDQVYVTGYTTSPDFPLKDPIQQHVKPYDPYDPVLSTIGYYPGQSFVATLSGSLSSIVYYSTYFGTSNGNAGEGFGPWIAVDPALNVYLAETDTDNIQPTPGAYSVGASSLGTSFKASIAKLSIMDDLALTMTATSTSVVPGQALVYSISVTSKGPDFGVKVRITDALPAGTNLVSIDCGGGAFSGTSETPSCTLPELDKGATFTVAFAVIVNAPVGTTLSNTATTASNMQDFVTANNSATITTKVD